jgi:glyoxylase-like metal-dependent hydrolase (beta-lactamase superfamily II)
MSKWKVGDVTITKIVESEMVTDLDGLIPKATRQAVRPLVWMKPHFMTDEGALRLSIHALVVETSKRRILVDTCVGNDKSRPGLPDWHNLQLPFLKDMEEAGFHRDSIDTVVCTHLHVDHVGWNTMYVDGKWTPTFPKARYLLGRKEFDYWQAEATAKEPKKGFDAVQVDVFADSVKPVFDAGLVDLVDADHRISDEVRLVPTHGHTPGHVSVRIESKGERALITGDFIHHPCQLAHPDWATLFDYDQEQSSQTRERTFDGLAGDGSLVIGTHWAGATAGRGVRDGSAYRLKVLEA